MLSQDNSELSSTSDADLLRLWIEERDAVAFREIVVRHADMVFATCKRVLGNSADAEEAVQECFVKLATKPLKGNASLGGWFHRVATHCSLSLLRSKTRRRKREEVYMQRPRRQDEPGWEEIQRHVDEAIAALPEKLQYAIVRHFLEGEPQADMAKALGITPAAVSLRIKTGIKRIRKHLKRLGFSVSTASLAAMLPTREVEATPPAIITALSKFALSGVAVSGAVTTSSAGATLAVGGLVIMKKVALVCLLTCIGAIGVWLINESDTKQEESFQAGKSESRRVAKHDVLPKGDDPENELQLPLPDDASTDRMPALVVQVVDHDGQPVHGGNVTIRWGHCDVGNDKIEIPLEELDLGHFISHEAWHNLEEAGAAQFVANDRAGEIAHLRVAAPGFLSKEQLIDVPSGRTVDPAVVVLDKGPILRGQVVDAVNDDLPIEGVRVGIRNPTADTALDDIPPVEAHSVSLLHEVHSDAAGRFEIGGITGDLWLVKEGFGITTIPVGLDWSEKEYVIPLYPSTKLHLRVTRENAPVEAFEYSIRGFNATWFSGWSGVKVYGSETDALLLHRYGLSGDFIQLLEYKSIGVRVSEDFVSRELLIPLGVESDVNVDLDSRETAIVGRVLDPWGAPLGGVRVVAGTSVVPVQLRGDGLSGGVGTDTTEVDGFFHIPIQPARVSVAALHPGYPVYMSDMTVISEASIYQYDIRFNQAARITGQLAPSITPREGRRIELSLLPSSTVNVPELYGMSKEATTDKHGEFVFESLPPGLFQVRLYDDISSTVAIAVRPGEEYRVILGSQAKSEGVRVEGRVMANESPLENVVATILSQGNGPSPIALSRSDHNGLFSFDGIRPGKHRLKVYAEELRRTHIVEIDVAPGVVPLEIDLSSRTLEGSVFSLAGPISGVEVQAHSIARHGFRPVWGWNSATLSDDMGRFRLKGLYSSPYRLTFIKEGFFTRTIEWALTGTNSDDNIEVLLESATEGGAVRFRVVRAESGQVFEGMLTVAVYHDPKAKEIPTKRALSLAEGTGESLSIRDLPTGNYRARIYPTFDRKEDLALEWVRFRHEAGVDQELSVSLKRGGRLRVTVATKKGVLPDWSTIELQDPHGKPISINYHNGKITYFRGGIITPPIPGGEVLLTVGSQGQERRQLTVEVTPGATRSVFVEYPQR